MTSDGDRRNNWFGQGAGLWDAFQPRAAPPPAHVATDCLGRAAAALASSPDPDRQRLAQVLASAELRLLLIESAEPLAVTASLAVDPSGLDSARSQADAVLDELTPAVRHAGWNLKDLTFVAGQTPVAVEPPRAPKRQEMIETIARAVAVHKDYEIAAFCDRLGFPAHPDPDDNISASKRIHVRGRLAELELPALAKLAGKVLAEQDDEVLEDALGRYLLLSGGTAPKNLVFGSTQKPDLVLVDALDNKVSLLNPDAALFYDAEIPPEGLTMKRLVEELLPEEAAASLRDAAFTLYTRLCQSLASPPERFLFKAYARRYDRLGFEQPALLPQVWQHFDPKPSSARGNHKVFSEQRRDFMLLLPQHRRVVLEVDGAHHYSVSGRAAPSVYAEMVREDRDLRLHGYEVFRFGGAELPDQDVADVLLGRFFDRLLSTDEDAVGR